MNLQSFGTTIVLVLRLPLWSPWESWGKVTFGCSFHGEAQSILLGGEWCLIPKVAGRVKFMFKVVPTKFVAPFSFNLH
jgi:hypothetical protein